RGATVLSTTLLVSSLLLLGLGVTQMANNIANGIPEHTGSAVAILTAILGAVAVIQAAGLMLAVRRFAIGYLLLIITALVWVVALVLDRTHVLVASAPYTDSVLSQGLAYTALA